METGGRLPFQLSPGGYSGNLVVHGLPPVERLTPASSLLPWIPEPLLPEPSAEALRKQVEEEALSVALSDDAVGEGAHWEVDWRGSVALLGPTTPTTALEPVWGGPPQRAGGTDENGPSEDDLAFREVPLEDPSVDAVSSSSLLRRPGLPEDFVRGSTRNHPFLPGGFDLSHAADGGVLQPLPKGAVDGTWLRELFQGGPFQTVAPGLPRGLAFPVSFKAPVKEVTPPKVKETPPDLLPVVDTAEVTKVQTQMLSYDDLFSGMEELEEEAASEEESEEGEERAPESAPAQEQPASAGPPPVESTDAVEALLAGGDSNQWWPTEKGKKGVRADYRKRHKEGDEEVWAVMDRIPRLQEQFATLVPEMAHSYPFELDVFQKEAVVHLERNESVFVAAHTSAGKTVVAEYAFALATKHCTRAIYTSPIKTISNQKFRDFSSTFDVGLLTGDVSIRPEAPCLIMTTEILRSMLYKGADLIRDVEWVIFDEVHYVNDVERGVVWEEVIIMLPAHVNLVLLSATVPNTFEFANWIGRTKRKHIYVTSTLKRPVPLEHHLYYAGELHKICEKDTFLPSGVRTAQAAHKAKNAPKPPGGDGRGGGGGQRGGQAGAARGRGGPPGGGRRGGGQSSSGGHGRGGGGGGTGGGWKAETSQWYTMVEVLRKKSLLPLVVFCFSKARCDSSADGLTALDLATSAEKSEIHRFCDKAFSRLKGSDRKLPQVLRIQELLQRGIGCHHAGLLPIVKEVVELLFCRGLLKLLFSTETFAMGVNAPARTVAFHSVRKHDGKNFRTLLPGEYTQMAGRAGRRGLDKVGTVLLMCWDEIPEEAALRTLLTGQPTRLESQFRLTYNMILNLLRVEDLKVEDMLKRSFAEFHAQRALPQTQQQLRAHEASLAANQLNIECILGDPTIAAYYEYARQVEDLTAELTDAVLGSRGGQAMMTSGRLIMVKTPDHPPTLGMVLREAPSRAPPTGATPSLPSYIVLGLHRGPLPPSSQTPPSVAPSSTPRPREVDPGAGLLVGKRARDNLGGLDYGVTRGKLGARGADVPGVVKLTLPHHGESSGTGYFVAEVRASDIVSIGRDKVRVEAGRILESEAGPEAGAVGAAVQRLQLAEAELAGEPLPEVEPRELKMASLDAAELYGQRGALLAALAGNPCATCPVVPRHYKEYRQHALLRERVRHLKHELSDDNLQQMPDFEQRVAVLQQLGYLDSERVVQIKGRVACEVNSGDELIAAEMILDNQLDDLEPAEAVALLSAFVFQDKSASEPELTATLAAARDRLAATALQLGKIQADYGLPIVPEDYLKGALNFGLMEVVYEWAQGTPFSDICALTDVPEGSIVRCIVRLDETCRETKNAARLIGNSSLYQKMEAASAAIKRDIVFAASLYVTGTASF